MVAGKERKRPAFFAKMSTRITLLLQTVWVLTLGRFITVEQTSDLDPELHREWI